MGAPTMKSDCTLQEKYATLCKDACRMASGFAALALAIEKDPDVAADICRVFEIYACSVLEVHLRNQEGDEA